jgi:hypothetical protein
MLPGGGIIYKKDYMQGQGTSRDKGRGTRDEQGVRMYSVVSNRYSVLLNTDYRLLNYRSLLFDPVIVQKIVPAAHHEVEP